MIKLKTDRSTLLALSVAAFNADRAEPEEKSGGSMVPLQCGPDEGKEECAELADRSAA